MAKPWMCELSIKDARPCSHLRNKLKKKMIQWFEKHPKVSWLVTFVIALVIFYISSLSFTPRFNETLPFKSIIYHLVVFFFFSIFLQISLTKGENKNLIILAVVIAIIYGISDEIHQFFVPGRSCAFFDVLTNSTGILIGAVIYALSFRKKATQHL